MCCLLSQAGSLWFYQQTPLSVPDCIHSHIHMLYMHRRSLVEAARTAVQQKSKCSVSDSVNGDGCMYLTVLMPHTHSEVLLRSTHYTLAMLGSLDVLYSVLIHKVMKASVHCLIYLYVKYFRYEIFYSVAWILKCFVPHILRYFITIMHSDLV